MKKILILMVIIFCSFVGFASIAYTSDITDTFSEKYSSLLPSKNSSVQSDYLFEQIALGGEYTVRLLDQINEQNSSLDNKADTIIEKFDVLINQNQKIIDLLEKLIKQED